MPGIDPVADPRFGDGRVSAALMSGAGVASRAALLSLVPRTVIDNEVRRNRISAVFPRTYARPWDTEDREVLQRAAVASVGGEAALSHTTALTRFGLLADDGGALHVTAFNPRHPRGITNRLIVHRTLLPLGAAWRDGVATVRPAVSLVAAWPLLEVEVATAAVLLACRTGLVLESDLVRAVARGSATRGITGLRRLTGLIAAGCESELEIWGYLSVFDIPGLRHADRQRWIEVGCQRFRTDMAYEEERLVVELDGRAYHASAQQWERDIARDLALARLGWQTVRLSHHRLTSDVDGCRRDLLEVLASRRSQARALASVQADTP